MNMENSNFQLENFNSTNAFDNLTEQQLTELLIEFKTEMDNAAKQLDFEQAARLRDQIYELERILLQ